MARYKFYIVLYCIVLYCICSNFIVLFLNCSEQINDDDVVVDDDDGGDDDDNDNHV